MCSFLLLFLNRITLLVTVSSLNFKNSEINSFKFKIFGLLFTIAKVLNPNELSMLVNLYSCLRIVSGSTAFLNSITTLIPLYLTISNVSYTFNFLSLTSWAIFSIRIDLFT